MHGADGLIPEWSSFRSRGGALRNARSGHLGGLVLLALLTLVAPPAAGQSPAGSTQSAEPLLRGHAHNDYQHERPLYEAIEQGFNSIEVDVHLVGDELLVAHELEEVDTLRTLESLYLRPLRERVMAENGAVHRGAPPLLLLIDIKSGAEPTYARLHPLLRRYADLFTITVGDLVIDGPVQAVISGNRPRSALLAAPVRFAAYDGRLADLEEHAELPAAFMPLISGDWARLSDWDGVGPPPSGLREELQALVNRAHAQGRRLRLWGTPDLPAVWELLHESGVDLINTDDLSGLRTFLTSVRLQDPV